MLKSKFISKLLLSLSKFSDTRKFTLRCQYFEIKGAEMKVKMGNVCANYMYIDIRGYNVLLNVRVQDIKS